VLADVLALVREREGEEGLEAFLRSVGRRAGERARAGSPHLRGRVEAAAALLGELGGLAEASEDENGLLIQGFSCPLAEIVGANPEACALAEELVSGVVGAPVRECCDRSGAPRCGFRIAAAG
jgi:predicted ArsR family transcriptional regulator